MKAQLFFSNIEGYGEFFSGIAPKALIIVYLKSFKTFEKVQLQTGKNSDNHTMKST